MTVQVGEGGSRMIGPTGVHEAPEVYDDAVSVLREEFDFDFVGLSLIDSPDSPVYDWGFGSGSVSGNFRLIRLPSSVGALGKALSLRRCLIADSVEDNIPENERFQYPIVAVEGLKSFIAFPLLRGDEVCHVIICGMRHVYYFRDAFVMKVQRFAASLLGDEASANPSLRIRGKQEGFAYSELSHRIFQAQEEERKRIARELHDGLSQEILVAQMALRKMSYLPQEEWPDAVAEVGDLLRETISHVGAIAKDLRPPSIDELGLASAIHELCETSRRMTDIRVAERIEELPELGEVEELAFYRVAQEALSNVCKYSQAAYVQVSLRCENGEVRLTVEDDGSGFDLDDVRPHGSGLGLDSMRERAFLIGAELNIESVAGRGTCVTLWMKEGRAR